MMDFRPNMAPVELTKKGAFGRIFFRDIYSDINGK